MRFSLLVRLPLTVLLVAAVAVPAVSWADSGTESQFVSATNSARSSHGLRHYTVASDLTAVARRWAAHMAAHHTLEHNPNYSSQICCWSKAGENVGVGSSVSQIERAFMNSAPHRANILSSTFTQVGIGTARSSDGRLWVDEIFRRPTSSAPRSTRTTTTSAARSTSTAAGPSHPAARRAAHPVARPVAGPVARPAAARASRGAHRSARAQPASAGALAWTVRLWWARAAAAPAATADPVSGALAYLRAMQRLAGSVTG